MFPQPAGADDALCPPCAAAWDAQPLGALVRRWTAEGADGDGRQAGLVCEKCKEDGKTVDCVSVRPSRPCPTPRRSRR